MDVLTMPDRSEQATPHDELLNATRYLVNVTATLLLFASPALLWAVYTWAF
jgi:hypothetical protein